ncbi:caspase family protein [Nocardia fluminea]
MTEAPERGGSRAVLMGVANYTHPEIPRIPAATNNVADLAQVLTAPEGGAFTPRYCAAVTDPDRSTRVGEVIGHAAREATDVLLVYYTGHGLLDRRGRLHLALTGSNPEHVGWTSVPFAMLREEILESQAHARVLILDCCFSGRAFEAMSDGPGLVAGQVGIRGTYTVTSSAANETSFAPAGHRNTAFTAALLTAAAEAPALTLDDVFRQTDRLLRRSGHPQPQRRSVGIAGDLCLFGRPVDESRVRCAADIGDLDEMSNLRVRMPTESEAEHKIEHHEPLPSDPSAADPLIEHPQGPSTSADAEIELDRETQRVAGEDQARARAKARGEVFIPELRPPSHAAFELAAQARKLAEDQELEMIRRTTPPLSRGVRNYGRSR